MIRIRVINPRLNPQLKIIFFSSTWYIFYNNYTIFQNYNLYINKYGVKKFFSHFLGFYNVTRNLSNRPGIIQLQVLKIVKNSLFFFYFYLNLSTFQLARLNLIKLVPHTQQKIKLKKVDKWQVKSIHRKKGKK